MRRKVIFVLIILGITLLLLAAKAWLIKVSRANLLSKPDFLSETVAGLKRGDLVRVASEQGNWLLVQNAAGAQGYIHRSALQESKANLIGLIPGPKGASDDEVSLAAKGFNEANEKQIRGRRGYNFGDLEWVLGKTAAPQELKTFIAEGKLK